MHGTEQNPISGESVRACGEQSANEQRESTCSELSAAVLVMVVAHSGSASGDSKAVSPVKSERRESDGGKTKLGQILSGALPIASGLDVLGVQSEMFPDAGIPPVPAKAVLPVGVSDPANEKAPSVVKCMHGRKVGVSCKECKGVTMCKHGRVKSSCKDCGGAYCIHRRVRSVCKECGGSSICQHSRKRAECRECRGSGICEHNKVRTGCKECGGSRICEHGRRKYDCKECGGSGICKHNRHRSRCKECREARASAKVEKASSILSATELLLMFASGGAPDPVPAPAPAPDPVPAPVALPNDAAQALLSVAPAPILYPSSMAPVTAVAVATEGSIGSMLDNMPSVSCVSEVKSEK